MKKPLPPFPAFGVRLRMLVREDLPMTLGWRNHDDARIWFKNSEPIAMEMHQRWFDAYQELNSDYVFIVEAHSVPVGQVSVYEIDTRAGKAEVGRFLAAPEHRNKGHIKAACEGLLSLCKKQWGVRTLRLEVLANNERAIRLYEHLGFLRVARNSALLTMERAL